MTDDNGDYYVFPVHKWFDKHQDDKQLSRDITPNAIQKKDEIESNRDQVGNNQDQPEPRQPLGKFSNFINLHCLLNSVSCNLMYSNFQSNHIHFLHENIRNMLSCYSCEHETGVVHISFLGGDEQR